MAERKRRCLEPDSFEEQEFRKSFEVEYNRSFDMMQQQQDSFDGLQAGPPSELRTQQQPSSDLGSQTSFDTELLTLREIEQRPSFDLPEEDNFIRERQKFYEKESDSLDLGTSTEDLVPALPPKKKKSKGNAPIIVGELLYWQHLNCLLLYVGK